MGDPDAKYQKAHQGGYSSGSGADGLDEVDTADDLLVFLLSNWKSGFTEKKLVGFVNSEVSAINHETDECSNTDAPDNGQNVKGIHGVPPDNQCADLIVSIGWKMQRPMGRRRELAELYACIYRGQPLLW